MDERTRPDDDGDDATANSGSEAQKRDPTIGPGTQPGDDEDDGTQASPSGRP